MQLAAFLALVLALPALAQKPGERAQGKPKAPTPEELRRQEEIAGAREWLKTYGEGAFRLHKDGREDPEAIARVEALAGGLSKWTTMDAAEALFAIATVEPEPAGATSPMARIDFHRELQPWKVRQIARDNLAAMALPELDAWLAQQIDPRAQGGSRARREAAMRVLARRGGPVAAEALQRAAGTLPPAERVVAIDTLAQSGAPESLPQLLGMLGDSEPNARIAALSGIAKALGPQTDETVHGDIPAEVAGRRDAVVKRLREILVRDAVWQVRVAAGEALAQLRCKAAIPALIDGLEAELGRKKDPWAVDLRLHRLLEGMTGQKLSPGQANIWREFWRAEGATFTYAKAQAKAGQVARPKQDRYRKFFSLELESDRVLFVVDFSGSMAEPVTLKDPAQGTSAQAPGGTTTTKAQLVVSELKKMILALPDGSMFNIVAFSDDVRVWRAQDDGRPALVKLDEQARDELLGSFLDSLQPRGPTNLYGALDKAIDFAGRGVYDKYYAAAFDTLYVLSDGAPSYGEVTDRDEICRRVSEANRLRKIVVNTITFGEKNDTEFLKKMAEDNGGRHIHIE
ncbi:MAG: VWA domain-containing protein [Planctomycetes bacterium]|nr:VWA domain-containing protein [Planctomycetota bacterium]